MDEEKIINSKRIKLRHIMIKKYALHKLKYDFMGYPFYNLNDLTFHHLIIPACDCEAYGYEEGLYMWNGAILRKDTSHEYLHTIKRYDEDRFMAITDEMIEENIKGFIDPDNLKKIDAILTSFEREYVNKFKKSGKPIIKEKYLKRNRLQ